MACDRCGVRLLGASRWQWVRHRIACRAAVCPTCGEAWDEPAQLGATRCADSFHA